MNVPDTNTGHGHVWKRPDGVRARCGGPGICRECAADDIQMKLKAPVSGAMVFTVIVIGNNRAEDHTHIFSTEAKAEEYANRLLTLVRAIVEPPPQRERGPP